MLLLSELNCTIPSLLAKQVLIPTLIQAYVPNSLPIVKKIEGKTQYVKHERILAYYTTHYTQKIIQLIPLITPLRGSNRRVTNQMYTYNMNDITGVRKVGQSAPPFPDIVALAICFESVS